MQGAAIKKATPGYTSPPRAHPQDLPACNDLCLPSTATTAPPNSPTPSTRHRPVAESQAASPPTPPLAFHGHAIAENNADLCALSPPPQPRGPGILVPPRNAALFRWRLANGLQVTQTMTLMTLGLYNNPAGAYLPSILY